MTLIVYTARLSVELLAILGCLIVTPDPCYPCLHLPSVKVMLPDFGSMHLTTSACTVTLTISATRQNPIFRISSSLLIEFTGSLYHRPHHRYPDPATSQGTLGIGTVGNISTAGR